MNKDCLQKFKSILTKINLILHKVQTDNGSGEVLFNYHFLSLNPTAFAQCLCFSLQTCTVFVCTPTELSLFLAAVYKHFQEAGRLKSEAQETRGMAMVQSETDAVLALSRSHVRPREIPGIESQYPVSVRRAGVDHLDAHCTP